MMETPILLNDLIEVFDDALEPHVCNNLIDLFESLPNDQEVIDNDKKPSFTQLNLTQLMKESDMHHYLINKTFKYKKKYYEMMDDRVFPEGHNFEYFRIKKYHNDGEDYFDTHVDVKDHESARRFLSFMFYLNTVDAGGETVFQGLTVQPKCGRLLVFPPLWMFPHKGCCPVSNDKYILTTYLHYR